MKTFDLPKDHGSNKTWMDVTLPSVEVFVKRNGFGLVSDPNQTSCSYFEIGAAMHEELGKATNELHIMFIAAAEYVLNHPELWKHFEFPPVFWEMAVKSFANRSETITGRMDFSITEKHGIKCYEYNADSASCLMECGYTQGAWAVAAEIDKYGEDAGSVTADNVTAAWKKTVPSGTLVHFLRDDDDEERYHTLYMMQLAAKAGIICKEVCDLSKFSFNAEGEVLDDDNNVIKNVWKCWSYVTLLSKLVEEGPIRNSGTVRLIDICFHENIRVFEPVWTAIISNKAILPILYKLYPDSPYVLKSSFELTDELIASGYASKPVSGRCGENVTLIPSAQAHADALANGTSNGKSGTAEHVFLPGRFNNSGLIYQELCALPKSNGAYVQINTFCAGGVYSGTVTRVDESPIIGLESNSYVLRIMS